MIKHKRGFMPFKLWIPMWLMLPPANTRFYYRLKRSLTGREIAGVRSPGDRHVTSNINCWNADIKDWRLPTRRERAD